MRFALLFAPLLLFVGCAAPVTTIPNDPPVSASSQTSGSGIGFPERSEWMTPMLLSRVTKKPFGLYVDPTHSPVSPERFTGYHTGADFEILPGETDIEIVSACWGDVVLNKWVLGYGGVVVQSCLLDGQPVTVLYGHLRASSVMVSAGSVPAGITFAQLGTAYSTETDGEREHLHLSIHRGTTVDLRGYVQNKADLTQWLDPVEVLTTHIQTSSSVR